MDEMHLAYKDAARKISEHNKIHGMKEPNALLITEILDNTVELYNSLANDKIHLVGNTENMSTIAFCDRFICKKCGIHLKDWCKVVTEEYEQGDETIYDESYYEYEFKYCPECGAKIIDEGDNNGKS
jgi:hypothetical protein